MTAKNISDPRTLILRKCVEIISYQNPVHSNFTNTSPGPGSGTGTSCRISSLACGCGLLMHAAVWYFGICTELIRALYLGWEMVYADLKDLGVCRSNTWGHESRCGLESVRAAGRGVFPAQLRWIIRKTTSTQVQKLMWITEDRVSRIEVLL